MGFRYVFFCFFSPVRRATFTPGTSWDWWFSHKFDPGAGIPLSRHRDGNPTLLSPWGDFPEPFGKHVPTYFLTTARCLPEETFLCVDLAGGMIWHPRTKTGRLSPKVFSGGTCLAYPRFEKSALKHAGLWSGRASVRKRKGVSQEEDGGTWVGFGHWFMGG